jgi:hypothetical protein
MIDLLRNTSFNLHILHFYVYGMYFHTLCLLEIHLNFSFAYNSFNQLRKGIALTLLISWNYLKSVYSSLTYDYC